MPCVLSGLVLALAKVTAGSRICALHASPKLSNFKGLMLSWLPYALIKHLGSLLRKLLTVVLSTLKEAKPDNNTPMSDSYVYGVSSFFRSGSSMMMRCLQFGGMTIEYDPKFDRMWWQQEGDKSYNPNPKGYFHADDFDTDFPTFYEDHKGHAIKIPRSELTVVAKGAYKVLFMTRDPQEILASMRASTPFRSWGNLEVKVHFYDLIKEETLKRANARSDMEVLEVQYSDVIANPKKELQRIREFGFPINVDHAAQAVEPQLYRHRI